MLVEVRGNPKAGYGLNAILVESGACLNTSGPLEGEGQQEVEAGIIDFEFEPLSRDEAATSYSNTLLEPGEHPNIFLHITNTDFRKLKTFFNSVWEPENRKFFADLIPKEPNLRQNPVIITQVPGVAVKFKPAAPTNAGKEFDPFSL